MNQQHSSTNRPGTNNTEDTYAKQVQNASTQKELEEIARAQLKQRTKDQANDLARRNYSSSSSYGRTLMKGKRTNKETGDVTNRIAQFGQLLQEQLKKIASSPGVDGDGYTQLMKMLGDLKHAKQLNPSYGGKGSNPLEIISVICLKVVIDSFSVVPDGEIQQSPLKSRIIQRLGQQLMMQHLDAVAFIASYEHDQEFIKNAWEAKVKDLKFEGSVEQFKWLCSRIAEADSRDLDQMIERREHLNVTSVAELLDRYSIDSPPNLYEVQEGYRESKSNQSGNNLHATLKWGQELVMSEVNKTREVWPRQMATAAAGFVLMVMLKPELNLAVEEDGLRAQDAPRHKKAPKVIKPTKAVLTGFADYLQHTTFGQMVSYPMVEKPMDWLPGGTADGWDAVLSRRFTPFVGIDNQSGGFHLASARSVAPLVRSRWEDNATIPSELTVEAVNTLQGVHWEPNVEVQEAFEAAVEKRMDIDKVSLMPLITVEQLKEVSNAARAGNGAKYGVPDKDTHPEEHQQWKQEQHAAYDQAAEAERKAVRTRTALQTSRVVREFDDVWWSYSCDYRLRIYTQATSLTPQGNDVEKVAHRFKHGEPITTEAQEIEIYRALGAALLGTRIGWKEREDAGRLHAPLLVDVLQGDADDILRLKEYPCREGGKGAKEVWQAFALMTEYRRVFTQWNDAKGAYVPDPSINWRVGIGIDASCSGVQHLSSLLLDRDAMLATNVIAASRIFDEGPQDAYTVVIKRALDIAEATDDVDEMVRLGASREWAEKHAHMDPVVRDWVIKILKDDGNRVLGKLCLMRLSYGAKLIKLIRAIRFAIADDMKIDLAKELEGWQNGMDLVYKSRIITNVTKFLVTAAYAQFPQVMRALDWLTALATASINAQLKKDPNAMPRLEWTLSDGAVISYWETELIKKEVKIPGLGSTFMPISAGDTPDTAAMVRAMAPSFVHSMDALLLRTILKDWDLGEVSVIHDCVAVLPSAVPALKQRIKSSMKQIIRDNPIIKLAEQMGINPDDLPELPVGDGDLDEIDFTRYIFH